MYGTMYNGHGEISTVNSGDYLRGSIQQTGRRALGLGVGDLSRELKPHRQVPSHEKPRTGVRDNVHIWKVHLTILLIFQGISLKSIGKKV